MAKKSIFRPVTVARGFLHDRRLAEFLERTNRRYGRWFGGELPIPQVTLLSSRRQLRQFWKTPQPSWLVGWYRNQGIYVFNRRASGKTTRAWYQLIAHELAHVYINRTSRGHVPKWLNEGLAMFLAGQHRSCRPDDVRLFFSRRHRPPAVNDYSVGYVLVRFLLRRYGRQRMLKLLERLRHPRQRWPSAFLSVYRQRWDRFLVLYGHRTNR